MFYTFLRAAVMKYYEWLKTIKIYCLIVLERRSLEMKVSARLYRL